MPQSGFARAGETGSGLLPRPYGVLHAARSDEIQAGSAAGSTGTTPEQALFSREDEDPIDRQKRAEAVLLLSKTPLNPRKLAQMAYLADATEARTLVRQLNQVYEENNRALRIEQVAGGYRMLTRPALAPWLARLGHLPPVLRLSSPMMETLAVVAYRQPVSRANVDAVRGVGCGELLRQLMERDLIRISGRAEELGRPYLYGTTKRFLQLFGLPQIDALPTIDWQTLEEDSQTEDSNLEEMSTSTKESVVSTAVASVVLDADLESVAKSVVALPENEVVEGQVPNAVIEDEEDDLYEGTDDLDDDDDDWGDDDDDWGDEDDDDDFEDDDDDDLDDLEDDEWEEVDDSDDDLDDDDDEDVDDDYESDEEDWDDEEEDDDVEEEDAEEEDEDDVEEDEDESDEEEWEEEDDEEVGDDEDDIDEDEEEVDEEEDEDWE